MASVTAAHTPWRMRTRLSTARSGYSAAMNVALAPLEADIQYLSSRRVRVVLAGELNSDSATMARQVFHSAVAAGYTEVEVDAHALSLGDVQGLDVLESAQLQCAEHDGLLLLLGAPPMVRRILEVTGLESLSLSRA